MGNHKAHVKRRNGAAVIASIVCLMVVLLVTSSLVESVILHERQTRHQQHQLQALWLAQAALQQAQLQRQLDPDYSGGTQRWSAEELGGTHAAVVETRIEREGGEGRIRIEAVYPDNPATRVLHRSEITFSDRDTGEAS